MQGETEESEIIDDEDTIIADSESQEEESEQYRIDNNKF